MEGRTLELDSCEAERDGRSEIRERQEERPGRRLTDEGEGSLVGRHRRSQPTLACSGAVAKKRR